MKPNMRLLMAALILAMVAALGFSRGVWAGPVMEGTVPSCATTNTTYIPADVPVCSANVVVPALPAGQSVTATDTDVTPFGMPPGGKFTYGVTVTFLDQNNNPIPALLVDVCFPDPTGEGVIYRYWTPSDFQTYFNSPSAGRWVVTPTFHDSDDPAGFTCAETWLGGVYTIIY